MSNEIRSQVTPCGDLIRATVFTERGTSSKTCHTMAEAQAFIALVKARKSWVAPKRPSLRAVE